MDKSHFASEEYLNSFIDINISPARVIQKQGALLGLPEYLMPIGDNFAVITRPRLYEKFLNYARKSLYFSDDNIFYTGPVCCRSEAERLYREIDARGGFDAVIAIGGGTVMDIAKLTAYNLRKQLITIPTSAATCAAFTALAVLYDENGVFSEYEYLNKNPDLCVIEPGLVAGAGARLTAAGFSDTLAKFVEGEWSYSGKIRDYYSELGLGIAFKIYNEIISIGGRALQDIKTENPSREAFEAISYNIVASGLSSGISGMKIYPNIAHSIANGITAVCNGPDFLRILHGEGVAFGMMIGKLLMERDHSKITSFREILISFGQPASFSEIMKLAGIALKDDAHKMALISKIVEKTMDSRESIHDITRVSPELLTRAFIESDALV